MKAYSIKGVFFINKEGNIMKASTIIISLIVLIAAIALVVVSLDGNKLFDVAGASLIYFAGAACYFIYNYTLKKRS